MATEFDFSEFNVLLNDNALKEIENATKGAGKFNLDLPENVYSMSVNALALVQTRNGSPAVKCVFRIEDGNFKGDLFPYWLYLTKTDGTIHGFKVHIAQRFLTSLSGDTIKCSIQDGFEKFAKDIDDIFKFAQQGYYDMKLSYNYPNKDKNGNVIDKTVKFPSLEPINFNQFVD